MSEDSHDKAPGAERGKSDAGEEFFSVGAPLHAVRASYIQRRADDLLFEALVACRNAHVIAPDRSGKTSLIAATAARLEPQGHKVAILDLEQIGTRDAGGDAGRWYYSVAYRLLRQLRIRFDLQDWWQDKSVLSNRQRLLEFYSEVVLRYVQEPVAVFVDEVQCAGEVPDGDQLLASIRAAHNARTTDPEFSRLTFVLLGECDPQELIAEAEASPFVVSQSIPLDDFSHSDLTRFATELNLPPDMAEQAIDRIYYWTRGQPYLTQKLARAVSRDALITDVDEHVDTLVMQQLAGRAALHSEPMMNHIHRRALADRKRSEALLNLYGRLRKGVPVLTDMGSPVQRQLLAIGLIEVDDQGHLRVRNRIFETVFTARWANENLPTHWRGPAIAAGLFLVMIAVPFWYTQLLPKPYVRVLTDAATELDVAETTWTNYRSFPLHTEVADGLYLNFLEGRAAGAADEVSIAAVAEKTQRVPGAEQRPTEMMAAFWDRRVRVAMRDESRDDALVASLRALLVPTPERRNRAAMLAGDDYPLLVATFPPAEVAGIHFNPANLLLTSTTNASVSQWSLTPEGLEATEPWSVTALEVTPLVRRVIVDREGTVDRISLTLTISHPRLADLRIKVIAPSGRAVEIVTDRERASSADDIRIPARQLADLRGENLAGTWSLSVRDEEIGVAGHLVGWNLTINSQGLVEDFQRGLDIPEPVERETDSIWIAPDGRYAVARAMQSDSARVWDLAFAKPVRAVAVPENEQLVGVDKGARHLVTATLETVNLWDTVTGNRAATLPVGSGSMNSQLTGDGAHLFLTRPGDAETHLELWSLESGERVSELDIAAQPALIALDASGSRIAVADFDRAVRVWDFVRGEMLVQLDLVAQPSDLSLSAGGDALGVVYGNSGAALWNLGEPGQPLIERVGEGNWQLRFSPSGASVVIGENSAGYQLHRVADGRSVGPMLGAAGGADVTGLLDFSEDEKTLVTPAPGSIARFWRAPVAAVPATPDAASATHGIWRPSGDSVVALTPDASQVIIGDRDGHVHLLNAADLATALLEAGADVSFIGHGSAVRLLAVSPDGLLAASADVDNTVRVWSVADGRPFSYTSEFPGGRIIELAFSPDGSRLAVLMANRVEIIDAATGTTIVSLELGESHESIAFASESELYVGTTTGALRLISPAAAGNWTVQQLWQGEHAIRWLEASPRGRYLAMVDDARIARLFSLVEGRLGARDIQLADDVDDVVFQANGTRVLFRTSRWIHRASATAGGLNWVDAMFAPPALPGSRIVFGPGRGGDELVTPVLRDGSLQLATLRLVDTEGPGLFGNRDELIAEWQARLSSVLEPSEAESAD